MFKNFVVIASLFAVLLLFTLGCMNAVSYTVPQDNSESSLALTSAAPAQSVSGR